MLDFLNSISATYLCIGAYTFTHYMSHLEIESFVY